MMGLLAGIGGIFLAVCCVVGLVQLIEAVSKGWNQ